jgi:hypothetical protein
MRERTAEIQRAALERHVQIGPRKQVLLAAVGGLVVIAGCLALSASAADPRTHHSNARQAAEPGVVRVCIQRHGGPRHPS